MSLAEQFQNYRFLSEEFSKIVLQGEAKGSLGKELIFYSEWTRKQLFKRLHHVDQESREAIIQLVDTQKELYALQNNGRVPTVEELLNEGYIKREHAEIYQRP